MLKAKKLVLAGDPMQLGPTIISEGNLRHQKNKDSKPKSTASSNEATRTTDESEASNNSDVDVDSDDVTEEKPAAEKVLENDNGQKKEKKTTCVLRPPRSLNKTLFDRMEDIYGSKVKLMLNVQYRLVYDIPSINPCELSLAHTCVLG